MKNKIFLLSTALLILFACSSKVDRKTEVAETIQVKYIDRGTVSPQDTVDLNIIEGKLITNTANDQSYKYLRQDNYCIDQFSCVVEGSCYYRLTNIHPKSTITGYVKKSWIYNNETITEDVPFTIKPKEWKTFGCFFVTRSQPVTFRISSSFLE